MRFAFLFSAALLTAFGIGCTGEIPEARNGLSNPADSPTALPLRRLTAEQYESIVRGLLKDATLDVQTRLPPDVGSAGFLSNAEGAVDELGAEAFASAAESLAAAASLPELLPCAAVDRTCARTFVEDFASRAFRKPATEQDVTALMGVYDAGAAEGFGSGIRLVIEAVLQAPDFLYRTSELPSSQPQADPYAVASRLSFLIWNTGPDEALLQAAAHNALGTADEVEEQAQRMLESPRAREGVANFFLQWLGSSHLQERAHNGDISPELADGFLKETSDFAEHLVLREHGDFASLLRADFTIATPRVADIYDAPQDLPEGSLIPLPSVERSGLLTQGTFLASTGKSVVHRGLWVRLRALCGSVGAPPPNADELGGQDHDDPACRSCHKLMDPLGQPFEAYDDLGVYLPARTGEPVDTAGEIVGAADANGSFDDVHGLAELMAQSDMAHRCLAQQWFQFAFGRFATEDDQDTLRSAQQQLMASGGSVRELVVALARTALFRGSE